jgi:hypothetical protein
MKNLLQFAFVRQHCQTMGIARGETFSDDVASGPRPTTA